MIPISTTTIKVEHPDAAVDDVQDPDGAGYGTPSDIPNQWTTTATGVRAVISPTGGRSGPPGDTQVVDFMLVCDPIVLRHTARVTDEATGRVFSVDWTDTTDGVANLGHTRAGLTTVTGMTTTPDVEER